MALGAVAALLLACPVTAPARVTVDQTMHAACPVRRKNEPSGIRRRWSLASLLTG